MIVVGCVGREWPWSFAGRLPRSRTRHASAPVTPEVGEVVVSQLRPAIG